MKTRLDDLKRLAPFVALYPNPTDDLPVNLRVPVIFKDAYNLMSAHPRHVLLGKAKRIEIDRVLPPHLTTRVKDFQVTYETMFTLPNQDKAPVYLYVWEAPVPAGTPSSFADAKGKPGIEAVDVLTPRGDKLTWYKRHDEGMQSFRIQEGAIDVGQQVNGVFELWAYPAPGWDVILGWRATDKAWAGMIDDVPISKLPPLVAGAIVLPPAKQPPSEAAKK